MALAGFALSRQLDGNRLLWALAAATVLLLVWLTGLTRVPVTLFRHQYLASDRLERVVSMSHYTCAPLVLTPLHLPAAGLVMASGSFPGHQHVFVAIAVLLWVVLIAVQMGLWFRAAAVLSRRTMNADAGDLLFLLLAMLIGWGWKSAVYLVGLPALMWWSAKYLQWI
jgi:hypothetical protein